MFFFYMLPALPFLVLAVTYCLGVILGAASDSDHRRAKGVTVVAVYVGLVALNFLFFYPIYTGASLTVAEWDTRMWFDSWI
jgi:dolichyl-phosphate-mannose-protein mannosyltransferase